MSIKYLFIKYWWFIVLLLVAGFYLVKNLNKGTLSSKEIDFSIAKFEKIERISFTNLSDSISLTLTDKGWMVNEKFHVRSEAINDLFIALQKIRAASPVPLSILDSLKVVLNNDGLRVKVFSGRKKLKSFTLYRTQTLGLETIGMLSQAKNAYRLELPGYQGDILDLFSINIAHWQSKQLGIPDIHNIAAVEVEIPLKPELSYRIDVTNNDTYRLFALYQGHSISQFDTTRIQNFLVKLSQITYKERVNDLPKEELAAILLMEPDFIFNIYPAEGTPLLLRVIPIPIEEHLDEFGRPVRFDLNNLYINIDGKPELYRVAYIDYHPILRDIFYFNPIF
jgi:hypothetical protein